MRHKIKPGLGIKIFKLLPPSEMESVAKFNHEIAQGD